VEIPVKRGGRSSNVRREVARVTPIKRTYESTFIINSSLEDGQMEGLIAKVSDSLVKSGSQILDVNRWGRKRFTYPIKKRNNGFYVCIRFTGTGDIIPKLERMYQLEENILRSLTIVLESKALKALARIAERKLRAEEEDLKLSEKNSEKKETVAEKPASTAPTE